MNKYENNIKAIQGLVKNKAVHRDVYVNEEVFKLEMENLFPNVWIFIGHASQIKNPGDFITSQIGNQPILVSRHRDQTIHVLYNRCPHKGVKIASEPCGNTGKFFRCPYHAWSFKTDGSLLAVPLKKGYDGTGFSEATASKGLSKVENVKIYKDFIFARLSKDGPTFEDYFGEALSTIDNMVNRSPTGVLEIVSSPIRYMHTCNWKMLVENQTDSFHPMIVHYSSAGTVKKIWEEMQPYEGPKPMVVECIVPFTMDYDFYKKMGIRVWQNGHGHTGVNFSIHSDYTDASGYFEKMVKAYGETKAKAILDENRHNTIYFPNIMVKGPIQTLRVFHLQTKKPTMVIKQIQITL